MRFTKILGGAGLLVATAVVGGTLIGSALAAPSGGGASPGTTANGNGPFGANGEYCDIYLDTFAGELGVSRDDLLPASKAAALAAIDAAVAAGDMDEDRAATLKQRIEAIDEAGCGMGFGLGFARGMGVGEARGFMHADVLEAAADALGVESADLIDRLADDTSLEEVAEAEGVAYADVKAAVLAAVRADLDAAVAEGLDQDRADAMLERIQTWLDEGGEAGIGRFGGPGGPGHRGGPWH
jgi:hypothetical protein